MLAARYTFVDGSAELLARIAELEKENAELKKRSVSGKKRHPMSFREIFDHVGEGGMHCYPQAHVGPDVHYVVSIERKGSVFAYDYDVELLPAAECVWGKKP